jgi:hypothetical protein
MRILVTEGAAAVTATRSLGRRGYEVLVGRSRNEFSVAGLSRYCAGIVSLPCAVRDPERYGDTVLREIRRNEIDAVLPVTDPSLVALAPVRSQIEASAAYCAAPAEALERAFDKWGLIEAGLQCGLAAPHAVLVDGSGDWSEAIRQVGLPCVLRGRRSYTRGPRGLLTTRTGVHFRRDDADRDARARVERGEEFVVSAFSDGRGRGVYLFVAGGQALLWFGHDRIRETDPRGGSACAARSFPPSADLVARCTALLTGWGFEGAAMIEFRRDLGTGAEWLVEVNPRLWGSIALAVHAGIDFPHDQVAYFLRGISPSMPQGELPAIGARQLSAELVHVAHAWIGPPAGWERGYPTFPSAVRDFMSGFKEGLHYYHQSFDDPLPGVVEPLAQVFAGLRRLRS